jgi:hypothetical protein
LRFLTIIGLLIGLLLGSVHLVVAQTDFTPQLGDPPVASLINVSAPDANGMVTVNGSAGAVFPAATVAVRNLFTEQVVYVPAGITGSFMAQIYAPANTPLWISPSSALPLSLRDRPGSLPGGPGTIIYTGATESQTESTPITQLPIDGDFADWDAYPNAQSTADVRALINADSLYLALTQPVADGETLIIGIGVNELTYELSLNPAIQQAGLWRQVFPVVGVPQTIAVAMTGDNDAYEIRVNLADLNIDFETAYLLYVDSRSGDADSPEALSTNNPPPIPSVDERDGIVYSGGRMEGTLTRFSVSGAIAQGASTWTARGRIDTQTLNPGDTFTIEMDVTLTAPDLPRDLPGLSLIGDISLQPVALADGRLIPAPINASVGNSLSSFHRASVFRLYLLYRF